MDEIFSKSRILINITDTATRRRGADLEWQKFKLLSGRRYQERVPNSVGMRAKVSAISRAGTKPVERCGCIDLGGVGN